MALLKKKPAKDQEGEGAPPPEAAKTPGRKAKKAPKAPSGSAPSKSSKAKRFVFIVGDEGCILIFIQGAKVVRRLFAPSAQPAHTEAILEIIRSNPTVPISLLVDVMDQQYVPQTFPPVSSMSVGGLVKRRLDRDFQPEDLKGSLQLGRDKAGRREWRYLLIALAKTPLINDWIELLVNLPNEFKGVYLVPVEAVGYINTLNAKLGNHTPQPWQMLISHNKVSGFRQVVIQEGKLVFTRVSQAIDDAIPAVIAGNIEQEIINTMEYLKRLEFKNEGLLDINVIVSADVADSLDLKRFGFANIGVLTPLKVADALGMEQAALSADRFGDVVMAAAFGMAKKQVLRFSTPYMGKLAQLYQARRGIKAVAALAVVACIGLMLMSAVSIVQAYSATAQAEENDRKNQPDLEKARKQVAGLKVDVARKSAVITTMDAYLKNVPTPEEMAQRVAPLTNMQTRITSLTWKYSDPTAKREGGGSPPATPVSATLEVDMANAGNNQEKLTEVADRFRESLKKALPDYEITGEPAYKWAPDKSEKFTLDVNTVIPPEKKVATFMIAGPKKGKSS